MAYTASVQDGKLVSSTDTSSSSSSSTKKTSSGTGLGEQDFLQLLVAEMQYQDPLEPQTNTDYIAQLATFTQVQDIEDMQNVVTSMQASNLVGKYVVLNVTSSTTGETSTVTGSVDYVQYENNKAYLSINGSLYPISDLEAVSDEEYYEAMAVTASFSQAVAKLPSTSELTTSDETAITAARKIYTDMTTYQKKFASADDLTALTALETKLAELKKSSSSTSSSTSSSSTGSTTTV